MRNCVGRKVTERVLNERGEIGRRNDDPDLHVNDHRLTNLLSLKCSLEKTSHVPTLHSPQSPSVLSFAKILR